MLGQSLSDHNRQSPQIPHAEYQSLYLSMAYVCIAVRNRGIRINIRRKETARFHRITANSAAEI